MTGVDKSILSTPLFFGIIYSGVSGLDILFFLHVQVFIPDAELKKSGKHKCKQVNCFSVLLSAGLSVRSSLTDGL